jgi:hypothetical protein
MARLTGAFDFNGKLGNVSAYKRRDMDGTFVRTKGGATKEKIKTAKCFERTRENNADWEGCGKGAGRIRWALLYVDHLKDCNYTADLSKLCKVMQLQDPENERGKRSILFSQHRELLEGFRLTQRNPFDSVVRHPLRCEIDRETGQAWVKIPRLMSGINLFIPWQYPLFRFVISLQAIMDMEYNYPPATPRNTDTAPVIYTEWQMTEQNYEEEYVELQLKAGGLADDTWTMILSVGLEMGTPLSNNFVNTVKYVGCAKILGVG